MGFDHTRILATSLLCHTRGLLFGTRMSEEVRILDVKGLNCPMPLLKAKKTLNEMQALECLKVFATDPGSVRDFEVFARQSGNTLLESGQQDGAYVYLIQKKA